MAKISNPPRHNKAPTQHKMFNLTSLKIFSLKSVSQAGYKKYALATKELNIVLVNE